MEVREIEIGIMVSAGALLVSLVGLALSSRKDTRQDAAGTARVETKLDGIASGVEDIRVEMRSMRERLNGISERLSAVESSDRSAHRRIERMEGKR